MGFMGDDDILAELRTTGALLDGHFILSSGLHSGRYLQCAKLFTDAKRAERVCAALARRVREQGLDQGVDWIVSPAMGGVIAGYEMGRQLARPSVFFERVSGEFSLRRGFQIKPGEVCLVVDDVATTGLSSRECIAATRALGGEIKGACALVDRSGGKVQFGVPFVALLTLDIPNYAPDQLPDHLAALPAIKPGSRSLTS